MHPGKSFTFIVGATVLLLCFGFSTLSVGQSSNASLSGSVSDATGALIPGVTVTATNNGTSVVTTVITNEAGVYSIPSLLPGVYKVSAELPGFQTQTFTDVQLGNAAQVRYELHLDSGRSGHLVEVTVSADRLLLESTSSVGQVLSEETVRELPVIGAMGNDVLSLIRVMAGVTMTTDPIFGANSTELAGVSAANIQIQRDGSMRARGTLACGYPGRHDHESRSGRRNPNDPRAGRRGSRHAATRRFRFRRDPARTGLAAAPFGTSGTARSTPTRGPITASQPNA